MKIRTFIDRPILASVISVLILLLGMIGLTQLPIEQFPEIAPPTVSVSAFLRQSAYRLHIREQMQKPYRRV